MLAQAASIDPGTTLRQIAFPSGRRAPLEISMQRAGTRGPEFADTLYFDPLPREMSCHLEARREPKPRRLVYLAADSAAFWHVLGTRRKNIVGGPLCVDSIALCDRGAHVLESVPSGAIVEAKNDQV